jgi:WD40 repeat protein
VRASADGVYVASSRPTLSGADYFHINKWNPVTREYDTLTPPELLPEEGPWDMAWSPNGRYLAIGQKNGAVDNPLIIYKRDGDTFTALTAQDNWPTWQVGALAWDSAGDRLAISATDSVKGVRVYDFVADTLMDERDGGPGNAGGVAEWIAFMPGVGSRYIASGYSGGIYVHRCTETPMSLAVKVTTASGAAYRADSGLHWDASYGYLIAVGDAAGVNNVNVFDWDGSVIGGETLTLVGPAAILPATAPNDSDISADRQFLAVAYGNTKPMVYQLVGVPPVLTKLADLPATGGTVNSVSWAYDE